MCFTLFNQLISQCFCFSSAAVFERLRNILHTAEIDKRVQYMIEVMFAIRKDGFKVFTAALRPNSIIILENSKKAHKGLGGLNKRNHVEVGT